jgi:3-hydroxyacyl-CoA dehydrogenase/enoyl-CoA hydratase/3-hydroxybutyryl-CoA epimerase
MGKTPVIVADGPGFLVNRILMPYLNEALFLFDEGVSVEKTDGAFRDYGMPMGPFRLIDEVGIDVARDVAETLTAHFSDRMETGAFFDRIDGSGSGPGELLGKKSGKGFYVYGGKGKPSLNAEIAAYRGAGTAGAGSNGRAPDATDTLYRPLLSMVNEAARCLDDGIVDSPAELDLAMIMGTGFPAFRGGILRWADSLGLEEVENRLKRYADRHGKRFAPARGITSRVKAGKGFHDS